MDKAKFKVKFFLLLSLILIILIITWITPKSIPQTNRAPIGSPRISGQTITPLINTKHFLVSAYMDQRVNGFDIRIIGIFKRDSIEPLYCLFCCEGQLSTTTPATILQHTDNFGFPFHTTDVMCQIPQNCEATHVSLVTQPDRERVFNAAWLPIRNKKTKENKEKNFQFDFTVCLSTMYGDYNNVLQFAQTLEMYRLLGVGRVVLYNTSCGPELDRLLQSYSKEGFVEIVPWPIYKYLNPSPGWLFSKFGGDVHYYGQLATLNECIYRSMERSRYVLLNDIDEIIMPYQHDNLMSMMSVLQQQQPNTGVFLIESHVFPYKPFEESKKVPLPQWRGVPGFNIFERIYRAEPDGSMSPNNKMIVQPRLVEQTSVHEVLKTFGAIFKVPGDICRNVHVPIITQTRRPEQFRVDTRLHDFKGKILPRVIKVLRRAGLLRS